MWSVDGILCSAFYLKQLENIALILSVNTIVPRALPKTHHTVGAKVKGNLDQHDFNITSA